MFEKGGYDLQLRTSRAQPKNHTIWFRFLNNESNDSIVECQNLENQLQKIQDQNGEGSQSHSDATCTIVNYDYEYFEQKRD